MVQHLLSSGAELHTMDNKYPTPFEMIGEKGDLQLVFLAMRHLLRPRVGAGSS